MSFIIIYLITGLALLGFIVLLWRASLILKNSSIVDIFWGAGFVFSGWIYFALLPDMRNESGGQTSLTRSRQKKNIKMRK